MIPVNENPKLILTGFGKFKGVEHNPTELILSSLQQDFTIPNILVYYQLLEVSVLAANKFSLDVLNHTYPELIVHLGVNTNAEKFYLERSAFNNMTFRIPDEQGLQPVDCCIDDCMSFDGEMLTDINCDKIKQVLISEGFDVDVSNDPGRYLCNYLYYTSLLAMQRQKSKRIVVFVHVPPIEVVSLSGQITFVKKLLEVLANCYIGQK